MMIRHKLHEMISPAALPGPAIVDFQIDTCNKALKANQWTEQALSISLKNHLRLISYNIIQSQNFIRPLPYDLFNLYDLTWN